MMMIMMKSCTATTRTRFAASPALPTSDQKQASCFQRRPVGLDYYPNIQAHCPPPVIDQYQWVADILVSWLNNNQTDDGFYWHPNLTVRRKKTTSNSFLSFESSSLVIYATDSITCGERLLVLFPQLDTDFFEIMSIRSLLMVLLCNCPSDDLDQVHRDSSITALLDHGVEAHAAKDIQQGDELSFCEFLGPWCNSWLEGHSKGSN